MRSRSDLHDYQVDAYRHFMDHPKSAGFLDLGLGKTAITLTVLSDVLSDLDSGQALVIAPIRVAKQTWPTEIAEWKHTRWLEHTLIRAEDGDADVKAVFDYRRKLFLDNAKALGVSVAERNRRATTFAAGYRDRFKRDKRERLALTPTPLHIIGLPQVEWLVKFHGKRWPYRTVVVDESSAFKDFQTGRWRALNSVYRYIDRMHLLTASPAAETWLHLWAQVGLLDRGERLGRRITHYREAYFNHNPYTYSYALKSGAQEKISEAISDICLVMKAEDYLPLEKPNFLPRYIELSDDLIAKYDDFVANSILQLDDVEIEAVHGAALVNKLLQFTGGAVLDEERQMHEVHDDKLDDIAELIDELQGSPLMVGYWYQSSLKRLRKRFPKAVVMDRAGKSVDDWNAGKIPLLLIHPACLHPATEVLTEHRGWIRLVDVRADERVHDGVEFVRHDGCWFSGVKPVIDVFGISMTADHKLLVGGRWMRADDVRDSGTTATEGSYLGRHVADYDAYSVSDVLGRTDNEESERSSGQSRKAQTLSGLLSNRCASHDGHALSQYLARNARAGDQSGAPQLPPLWRRWAGYIGRLARLSQFLSRYVRHVSRQPYDRSRGQRVRLLQRELCLDNDVRPAVAQDQLAQHSVQGRVATPSRVLSPSRRDAGCVNSAVKPRNDGGRGGRGLRTIDLSEKSQVSPVYDLVNCGPRNRFLIRNDAGDVFVSHNSAGHGLNMQKGPGHDLCFFDPVWSRELYEQLIGRLARQGQKHVVRVHKQIVRRTPDPRWTQREREDAMTADEIVYATLDEKGDSQAALFHAIRRIRDRVVRQRASDSGDDL